MATTLEGSQTPNSERKLVHSHERKSIFKKKKNKNTPDNSPHGSRNSTPIPDGSDSPILGRASPTKGHRLQVSGKEEKKGFKLSKKSFRKVAKVVGITRSISKDKDKDKRKSDSIDEQDGEDTHSAAVASVECEDESKEKEENAVHSHPKRPHHIPLQPESRFVSEPSFSSAGSGSKLTANTPMIQGPARSVSVSFTMLKQKCDPLYL